MTMTSQERIQRALDEQGKRRAATQAGWDELFDGAVDAEARGPEIGLFDAIYSARALRRLKPDPVPEELITRILVRRRAAEPGSAAQVAPAEARRTRSLRSKPTQGRPRRQRAQMQSRTIAARPLLAV
jgi:hypothetical protein